MPQIHDIMAGGVYAATAAAVILVAVVCGWQWFCNRLRTNDNDRAQGVVQGICGAFAGEGLLIAWFTVSRFLDRPEWMYYSDWPLAFRLLILFGALRIYTSIFPGRRYVPAFLIIVGLAGLVGGLAV